MKINKGTEGETEELQNETSGGVRRERNGKESGGEESN